jgi:aromatic amino acid aminotransferase I
MRNKIKNIIILFVYLHTNFKGANPTGTILSHQRRLEIYKIVCENDLLLLEDDPYYFVQVF